jgi:hypothetical protein
LQVLVVLYWWLVRDDKNTKKIATKWWKNWGKIEGIVKVLPFKNGRFAHFLKGIL